MDPSRSAERADSHLLCATWALAAALLGCFAGADVSGLDAGEIGGAALCLGVAHPTGFPLDMLLLRAAALLPLGPLAFRQNVCTALVAASAVTAAVWLCLLLCSRCGVERASSRALAALSCAASLIGSATFLGAALSVEVYATSLACLLLSAAALEARRPRAARALGPVCGLALGTHVTAPLLLWPLALRSLWGASRRRLLHALACACLGALLIAYLPLASAHAGAFDWGHPATLEGLWRHVSAARIREAFAPELFGLAASPRVQLFGQLAEAPLALLAALIGLIVLLARGRQSALFVLGLISLDLAYATWINPMGISERQVGHASVALIGVLAGVGGAVCLEQLRARLRHGAAVMALCISVVALTHVVRAAWPEDPRDGHAVAERHGALSPLLELPARAVYVCESDSACASALYAVYAEGARPDLTVVPAQHLWDRSVLRRLSGLDFAAAAAVRPEPGPALRRSEAERHLQQLLAADALRPVYLEALPPGARALDVRRSPFLRAAAPPQGSEHGGAPAAEPLRALSRARFGERGPHSTLTRELWSSAYEQLGKAYLQLGQPTPAVSALREAVTLTPRRASLRSNLGVAFEQQGDRARALEQTAQAVELDPSRPTPWVNLARLVLGLQGPAAASDVVRAAQARGVVDPRLRALARELGTADVAQGTTRR